MLITRLDPRIPEGAPMPDLETVADLLIAIKDAARGNPMIQELVSEALDRVQSAVPVLAWAREAATN